MHFVFSVPTTTYWTQPALSWHQHQFPSHPWWCMFVRFRGDREDRVHRRSLQRRGCSQSTGPPGGTAVPSTAPGRRVWASEEPAVLLLGWSLVLWLQRHNKDENIRQMKTIQFLTLCKITAPFYISDLCLKIYIFSAKTTNTENKTILH